MGDNKTVRNMKEQMANILTGGGPLNTLVEHYDNLDNPIPEGTKVKIVSEGFTGSSFATHKEKKMHGGERGHIASPPVKEFGKDKFEIPHYFVLLEGQAMPYLISENEFYECDWK